MVNGGSTWGSRIVDRDRLVFLGGSRIVDRVIFVLGSTFWDRDRVVGSGSGRKSK